MSKVLMEREDLVNIADSVRSIQGTSDGVTVNDIMSKLRSVNSEKIIQSDLIDQIAEVLEGADSAGGGSQPTVCDLFVDNIDGYSDIYIIFLTVDENGVVSKVKEELYSGHESTFKVVNNSYCVFSQKYTNADGYSISASPPGVSSDVISTGVDGVFIGNLSHYEVYFIQIDCCFVAGTQVKTSLEGCTKSIEDIVIGDEIVAYNIETGENYLAKVKKTITNRSTTDIAEVTFSNGSILTMNAYHPIYTENGFHSITKHNGYDELVVGDKAKTLNGWAEVTDIKRYQSEPIVTYNLDVIDRGEVIDNEVNDTYYANGIVVHNASCPE